MGGGNFYMSSPQVASDNLSPAQASFIYWLNGLAQVATNIVTPLVVYWRMRNMPQGPLVKYNQQVNEVVRQFISGTIGLVSYFGGGELTRGLINGSLGLKKSNMDDASKHVAMIVGGVLASFIGFAFVRPYISTNLICKFLKQERGVEASFTEKEVLAILNGAKEGGGHFVGPEMLQDTYSMTKATQLLAQKKKALISAEAGAKSKHWLIGPLQNWVDRHLVPQGKPDLVKLARYSTLALTGYLSALTVLLWGVNWMMVWRKNPEPVASTKAKSRLVSSPLYATYPYATHRNNMGALPSAMPQLQYGNQWQTTAGPNSRMLTTLVHGMSGLAQVR
jgi:hypothetical protein